MKYRMITLGFWVGVVDSPSARWVTHSSERCRLTGYVGRSEGRTSFWFYCVVCGFPVLVVCSFICLLIYSLAGIRSLPFTCLGYVGSRVCCCCVGGWADLVWFIVLVQGDEVCVFSMGLFWC